MTAADHQPGSPSEYRSGHPGRFRSLSDPMSRLPLYLTQFLSGVVWVSLGPLLNSIMSDLDIPLAQGGLPALAFFLGGVIGVVSLNCLLAKAPVKWCLVGAALLESAGLAATGLLTQGLWSFVVAYFVVGLPCVILAGIPGMWVSAHVRERTAWVLNITMLSSVVAMTITPLVLGVLVSRGATWRGVYAAEAVFALLIAVIIVFLPLADIPGRENLRLRQLRAVAAFSPRLLVAIALASFMYLGAEMTLGTWLPKFQVDVFGASEAWAGLTVTFYFVGQILGRLAVIPATRRFPPSSLLAIFGIAMAAFIVGVAVSPSQAASLALTFCVGLGSCASFSMIGSYSSKFPAWHAGVVFSIFQLVGGVGAMVFPYLTGPVAAAAGFRAAIAIAAVPALIVALLALVLRKASGEGGAS
jgi:fucose permease